MKKFKTKVEKCGVVAGTPVTWENSTDNKNTGKLLCTIPTGGGLFYDRDELEPME